MSELVTIPRDELAAAAEALHTAAGRTARVDGEFVAAVPRWVVKAYVWSVFRDADPAEACARAHFGKGDLGDGAVALGARWAKRLAALPVTIPLAPVAHRVRRAA